MSAQIVTIETTNVQINKALTEKQIAQKLAKQKKEQIKNDVKKLVNNIKTDWLEDTRSKTALEKYVRENSEKFEVYLNLVNKQHNTNIQINEVNKQLFKFAYKHELNSLDYEGDVIEAKQYFNIALFVASSNSLLNRFAKFKNANSDKFKTHFEQKNNTHLDSKFKALYTKVGQIKGNKTKVQAILKNSELNRNEKAEQIKKLIK